MGVKFAGARSLDGRRRRRLIVETDTAVAGGKVAGSSAGYLKIRRFDANSPEPARSPIVSLIPRTSWKIWAICLLLPILACGLQVSCLFWPFASNPSAQPILGPDDGHLWRFVRGLTLVGCAALCWIISWFRSASVRDFEGCFKSWYWSGWIFLGIGVAAGTDAHLAFSELLQPRVQLKMANFAVLIWIAPLLSLLIEPFRCFTREMWHCRRSWLSLWGGCLAGLMYLFVRLDGPQTAGLLDSSQRASVAACCSVMWGLFLFIAMLSQVHYVMYVSSDPVPKRQSWLWQGICAVYSGFWRITGQFGAAVSLNTLAIWETLRESGARRAESASERRKVNADRRAAREAEKASQTAALKEKQAAKIAQEKQRKQSAAAESADRTAAKERQRAEREAATQKAAEEKLRLAAEKKSAAEAKRQAAEQKKRELEESRAAQAAARKEKQDAAAAARQQDQSERESESAAETSVSNRDAGEQVKTASAATVPPSDKPRVRVKANTNSRREQSDAESEMAQLFETPPTIPMPAAPVNSPVTEQFDDEDNEDGGPDGIDPALLKGLSKKEKRRLRKQHRDAQRAKAG